MVTFTEVIASSSYFGLATVRSRAFPGPALQPPLLLYFHVPALWEIGLTTAPYDNYGTPSESHGKDIAKYKI
jgi:hypothetical protein